MKLIQTLSDRITEEISDAKTYAKLAIEYRDKYPNVAQTLYDISQEEFDHMNRLHAAVANLIEEYRRTNGEPPAAMMAVYDYLHKQQIKKANKAKAIQAIYMDA